MTEAVEEVISEHYNAQIRELIDSGLEDEQELRDVREEIEIPATARRQPDAP